MVQEDKNLQKKEVQNTGVERTRSGVTFSPLTDIMETKDGLTVIMDIPGVKDNDVDINLKNEVLTITAKVEPVQFEGMQPLYREYMVGDFQRSFRLLEEIEAEKISAVLKNGVLTLTLPRAEKAKPRKIQVKAE